MIETGNDRRHRLRFSRRTLFVLVTVFTAVVLWALFEIQRLPYTPNGKETLWGTEAEHIPHLMGRHCHRLACGGDIHVLDDSNHDEGPHRIHFSCGDAACSTRPNYQKPSVARGVGDHHERRNF